MEKHPTKQKVKKTLETKKQPKVKMSSMRYHAKCEIPPDDFLTLFETIMAWAAN